MQQYYKYNIQNYLNITIYYNLINLQINPINNKININFKKNSIMFRKILNLIIFNIYYYIYNVSLFKFNKFECLYFSFGSLSLLSTKSIIFFYNSF